MSSLPTPRSIGPALRRFARGLPRPGSRWREAALEGATLGVVAALLAGIAVTWYKTTGGGKAEPPAAMAATAPPSGPETAGANPTQTIAKIQVAPESAAATPRVGQAPLDPFAFPFEGGGMVEPLPPVQGTRPTATTQPAAEDEVAATRPPAPAPTTGSSLPAPVAAPNPAHPTARPAPPRPMADSQIRRQATPHRARPELIEPIPSGPRPRPPVARGPAPVPGENSRCLVAGREGEAVVARVLRRVGDRLLVTMPDGSIGWAGQEVATEAPFRPWTIAEAREHLIEHEYRGFRAVTSEHYLVVTQGRTDFARRSADVLESIHRGLSDALRDGGLDARAPEFPLVAVIFRDREAFLAHRAVESEVQAYYEAYSNRIFLYETSEAEERAPDLAAMRKSHTVAHEGVHQYLQNAGIQPRLADWPAWLVEGLAEYYAPPLFEPGEARARFGAANPFHMATLHDLRDPAAMWEHLARDHARPVAPGRPRPAGWIEQLVSAEALSPTDYALAWALTHYLARQRPNQLKAYIQILGKRAPLEERSGREHLDEFIRAFHRDLGAMGGQVDRHLVGLSFVPIPFHAVLIERPIAPGRTAREALVSQSHAMIERMVEEMGPGHGSAGHVWTVPCFTRNQARQVATGWLSGALLPEGVVPWRGGAR